MFVTLCLGDEIMFPYNDSFRTSCGNSKSKGRSEIIPYPRQSILFDLFDVPRNLIIREIFQMQPVIPRPTTIKSIFRSLFEDRLTATSTSGHPCSRLQASETLYHRTPQRVSEDLDSKTTINLQGTRTAALVEPSYIQTALHSSVK